MISKKAGGKVVKETEFFKQIKDLFSDKWQELALLQMKPYRIHSTLILQAKNKYFTDNVYNIPKFNSLFQIIGTIDISHSNPILQRIKTENNLMRKDYSPYQIYSQFQQLLKCYPRQSNLSPTQEKQVHDSQILCWIQKHSCFLSLVITKEILIFQINLQRYPQWLSQYSDLRFFFEPPQFPNQTNPPYQQLLNQSQQYGQQIHTNNDNHQQQENQSSQIQKSSDLPTQNLENDIFLQYSNNQNQNNAINANIQPQPYGDNYNLFDYKNQNFHQDQEHLSNYDHFYSEIYPNYDSDFEMSFDVEIRQFKKD